MKWPWVSRKRYEREIHKLTLDLDMERVVVQHLGAAIPNSLDVEADSGTVILKDELYEATKAFRRLSGYTRHLDWCPASNNIHPPNSTNELCNCGLSKLLDPGLE